MASKARTLTYETIERFEAWVRAHCPCAFDDPKRECFRGLLFICEEEVRAAVERERNRVVARVIEPSPQ